MVNIKEEWKDIEGYEGLYQVSNYGRVKSLKYRNKKECDYLNLVKDAYGYLIVCLSLNGVSNNKKVHRLVAEAFIPNPENKPCVGHLKKLPDGTEDRTANEVWNLAWMTYKENYNYGSCAKRAAAKNTNGKKSKKVYQYTLDGELVKIWESTKECGRNGFDSSDVSTCCRGGYGCKTHKGYKWSYEPL